jgi:hypothetical protein
MFRINGFIIFLFCLSWNYCQADKIEKKGTILNSNCNPIGTNCKATSTTQVTYSFIFNEPRKGSLGFQISVDELKKLPAFQKVLLNSNQFRLEEAMSIPDEIAKALQLPVSYKVPPGLYRVTLLNSNYTILFKE